MIAIPHDIIIIKIIIIIIVIIIIVITIIIIIVIIKDGEEQEEGWSKVCSARSQEVRQRQKKLQLCFITMFHQR